jgi:hypothetical protein
MLLKLGAPTLIIRGTFTHFKPMVLYNTNGFRTEVMKDYYITMGSMFLVVKLYFHPSIGYANFAILLP